MKQIKKSTASAAVKNAFSQFFFRRSSYFLFFSRFFSSKIHVESQPFFRFVIRLRKLKKLVFTTFGEIGCLLPKVNSKQRIKSNLDIDKPYLTDAEKKTTYQKIKEMRRNTVACMPSR